MGKKIPIRLFATLFLCYCYIDQRPGWNQNTRFDLLHALFTKGTLAIDGYDANTLDKARIGDHYFCDKAPGGVAIALPAFALAAGILKVARVDLDSPSGWKASQWITTSGSVGLLTAIAGVSFFSFLAARMARPAAALATLGVFLGAMPLPYATMLFAHGAVMSLLFIALWSFDRAERGARPGHDYLIGFCCCLAAASEYPAALAGAAVFVAMLTLGWRRAVRFAAAAFPPALLVPAYNWLVSGSPFTIPYSHAFAFPAMKEGLWGFTYPKLSVAFQLLFSEYRGLFLWSPVLLFCVLGFRSLRRESPRLFWLSTVVPTVMVAYVAGYNSWDGGWALGPRLISAAVPFLAIAAGLGLAAWPKAATGLGVVSVTLLSLATLLDAQPPQGEPRVLTVFYPQRFLAGDMAMNLGRLAGLRGGWSMVPFLVLLGAGAWVLTSTDDTTETGPPAVSASRAGTA